MPLRNCPDAPAVLATVMVCSVENTISLCEMQNFMKKPDSPSLRLLAKTNRLLSIAIV
jgi:hypothetical protein